MSKVYLITGANRGIGLAMVTILAATPTNTILATARNPIGATELQKLASKGNVHVLQLDVASEASINGLPAQLEKYAKDGIDYFISNAGLITEECVHPALTVPADVWRKHLEVNAIGPVLMSQKVIPYLLKKDTKVAFYVSSLSGSMGGFFEASNSAYGMSKAALNYFTKELSFELRSEGVIVVAVHPGVVSTDMGKDFLGWVHPEFAAMVAPLSISPEDSAKAQLELLHKLTLEQSGKFLVYTGDEALF